MSILDSKQKLLSGKETIGILHGDLNKGDNILWCPQSNEIYIIDFGLSEPLVDQIITDSLKHTKKLNQSQ